MMPAQHHNTMPLGTVGEHCACETMSSSCDDGSEEGTLRAMMNDRSPLRRHAGRKKKVLKIKASDLQNHVDQVDPKHVEQVMKRLQSDKPVTIIEKSKDNTVIETKRQLLRKTSSRLRSMIRSVSWVGGTRNVSSVCNSSCDGIGHSSSEKKALRSCLKNKREHCKSGLRSGDEGPSLSEQWPSCRSLSFRCPRNGNNKTKTTAVPKNLNRWSSSRDCFSCQGIDEKSRPTLPSRRFSWQSLSFRSSFSRQTTNHNRWDLNEERQGHESNGKMGLRQPRRAMEGPSDNSPSCNSCKANDKYEFTVVSPYNAVSPLASNTQQHPQLRRGSMDNAPVAPRRSNSNENLF